MKLEKGRYKTEKDVIDMKTFQESFAGTWRRIKFETPFIEKFLERKTAGAFHNLLFKEGMFKFEFPSESTIKCFQKLGSQCFDVEEGLFKNGNTQVYTSTSFCIEDESYRLSFDVNNGRLQVSASIPEQFGCCSQFYERDGKYKDDYAMLLKGDHHDKDSKDDKSVAPPPEPSLEFSYTLSEFEGSFRLQLDAEKEQEEAEESKIRCLTIRFEQDPKTQNWMTIINHDDTEEVLTLGYDPQTKKDISLNIDDSSPSLTEIRIDEQTGRVKYKRTFQLAVWNHSLMKITEEVDEVIVFCETWEKIRREEKKKKKEGLVRRIWQRVCGCVARKK